MFSPHFNRLTAMDFWTCRRITCAPRIQLGDQTNFGDEPLGAGRAAPENALRRNKNALKTGDFR